MSIQHSRSPIKPSSLLVSYNEQKPTKIRKLALKHIRVLQADLQFTDIHRTKRRYIKTFPIAKHHARTPFQNAYVFSLLKKQKRFLHLESLYRDNLHFIPNLVKIKQCMSFRVIYFDANKTNNKALQQSSSFRRCLTMFGLLLKQSPEMTEALQILPKCKNVNYLSLMSFGSSNPLKQANLAKQLYFPKLETLKLNFVGIDKNFLVSLTDIISSHPTLKNLNLNSMDWRASETDPVFKQFLSVLESLPKLTGLKLSNIFLDEKVSLPQSPLLVSISKQINLKQLTLGLHKFSRNQYPDFYLLCQSLPCLKYLNLEFDSLELDPELFQFLQIFTNLEQFHWRASFQDPFEPCIPDFERFLQRNSQLEELSFLAYRTPKLDVESFQRVLKALAWCPKLKCLDLQVRMLDFEPNQSVSFKNLSLALTGMKDLEVLSLNFQFQQPIETDLEDLAKSLGSLVKIQELNLHFPLVKGKCSELLLLFCQRILNLKQLKILKLKFCIDEPVNLESQVFDYLLERLPQMKELSLWYHDLKRMNVDLGLSRHLETKALDIYRLSSFILANVLDYIEKLE